MNGSVTKSQNAKLRHLSWEFLSRIAQGRKSEQQQKFLLPFLFSLFVFSLAALKKTQTATIHMKFYLNTNYQDTEMTQGAGKKIFQVLVQYFSHKSEHVYKSPGAHFIIGAIKNKKKGGMQEANRSFWPFFCRSNCLGREIDQPAPQKSLNLLSRGSQEWSLSMSTGHFLLRTAHVRIRN